jgi:imidazolonepropionase-like amidohydrolase
MKLLTLLLFVVLTTCFYLKPQPYDLVVKNATVFDTKTGKVLGSRSILIRAGRIVEVVPASRAATARTTLDVQGKLVTPGFVDTHIHPTDVFGDYDKAPATLPAESLPRLRRQLSDEYLPYGVTTAMCMGQPESWLEPILDWSRRPAPNHTDLYTTGGALISQEGRKPYVNHVTVGTPEAARQKVAEYHRRGIRHLKLYWRLRGPEFAAALQEAHRLGLRTYGHIDQGVMRMDTTLALGLRHYEHLLTLDNNVLRFPADADGFGAHMQRHYGDKTPGFATIRLEMFRYMHEHKAAQLQVLLRRLAREKATFSTAIHIMAEPFGLTYYSHLTDSTLTNPVDATLSPTELAHCRDNFRLFMSYAKQLADLGVKLRMGTDTTQGGQAMQSEQLLLAEYGFAVAEVLQISTRNGAEALGLADQYGSIEKGQRANLVVFERSPFADYRNFLAKKTIIKDGIVYTP